MSDRYSYLVVTLATALRSEQADAIKDAISLIYGVVHVGLGVPDDPGTHVANVREKARISDALWKALNNA